ncbi:hypothetical protein [Fimbriiglobus ruber]|uniref:Uncharacterized protein n=1 Tax=Fimbriiglobus ruber TaxID=1908690 RepID=A0A225EE74_9BACT|nr:hypothetical protein [Fimbriiglobus ruber]OWK46607.1 hypothetical protein FRUB_00306 [Fimbriiglobus ruber]
MIFNQINQNGGDVINSVRPDIRTPTFELHVLTCPGREAVLEETLASIARSDWHAVPTVHRDAHNLPDRRASMTKAARDLLTTAARGDSDYVLFFEDDVIVNRFLRHNLTKWNPIRWDFLLLGSLYQGGGEDRPDCGFTLYPAELLGGSQAIIIARRFLPTVLELWNTHGDVMQDLRMYRTLEGIFPQVMVHEPHLVQHRPVASTWDGRPHQSTSFNEDWRAE